MVMGLVPMIKYLSRFHWKPAFSGIYCSDIKFAGIKLGRQQLLFSKSHLNWFACFMLWGFKGEKKHSDITLVFSYIWAPFTQCLSEFFFFLSNSNNIKRQAYIHLFYDRKEEYEIDFWWLDRFQLIVLSPVSQRTVCHVYMGLTVWYRVFTMVFAAHQLILTPHVGWLIFLLWDSCNPWLLICLKVRIDICNNLDFVLFCPEI